MSDPARPREILTHSSEETIQRGREIGASLKSPLLVFLSGELGAGKTTLTKGIVAGLGAAQEDEVTSPTFTLIHRYDRSASFDNPADARSVGPKTDGNRPPAVYHVDLYRIDGLHDLETLGLDDIFAENSIVLVEWPDRLAFDPGRPVLRIHLDHVDESTRRITFSEPASTQ